MWPMGFISLSSSMRKAEEAKKSAKKPIKVSRTSIRLSPTKRSDQKLKCDKQHIVQKRLEFYESNESEESKNKLNLKSFAQFAVSTPEHKKVGDPQKYISRSLSLHSDDEDVIVSQRNVPTFRSSSQFEKYFSEGEGSTFSGHGESDAEGVTTDASISLISPASPPTVDQTLSDQEHSITATRVFANPKIKKVQFNPSSLTVYPKKLTRPSPDKSVVRNATENSPTFVNKDDSEGEDMSQKEWYKQVFRVVHKLDNLYSNYPIPQVDDSENSIPPRPRSRREFGRCSTSGAGNVFVSNNNNKNTRSNSLPSSGTTEYNSVQTRFKNSKRVVLTGEASNDKNHIDNHRSGDRIILREHKKHESIRSPVSEEEWQHFLRPPKSNIKLFEGQETRQATALFDFYAHYDNELSFKRGDHLNLIREVDDHWHEAELGGRKGLVPFNYLEVIKQGTISRTDETSGLVLKDFKAHYPSEISAKKNDIVEIVRHLRGDWVEVRIGSKSGLLPAHHVVSYLNRT